MSAMTSRMIETSLIFGTFVSRTRSSVRAAAAIILSTAFFAPAILTSPLSGMPPVITNFCIGLSSLGGLVPGRVSGRPAGRRCCGPLAQLGNASFHSCPPV